jgi:hypothetical protein
MSAALKLRLYSPLNDTQETAGSDPAGEASGQKELFPSPATPPFPEDDLWAEVYRGAKDVYFYIRNRCAKYGGVCETPLARLAKKFHVRPRMMQLYLADLCRVKVIQGFPRRGLPTRYVMSNRTRLVTDAEIARVGDVRNCAGGAQGIARVGPGASLFKNVLLTNTTAGGGECEHEETPSSIQAAAEMLRQINFWPKDIPRYARFEGLVSEVIKDLKRQGVPPDKLASMARLRLDDPGGYGFYRDAADAWHAPNDAKTMHLAKAQERVAQDRERAAAQAQARAHDEALASEWQRLTPEQQADIERRVIPTLKPHFAASRRMVIAVCHAELERMLAAGEPLQRLEGEPSCKTD